MKTNFKLLLLIPVLMLIVLFGCRKPATKTATQKALFGLHLHTSIDVNQLATGLSTGEYSQVFQDKNGRWVNITNADIYLTNVGLHSATTGQWYTIPGSILLKRLENEEYSIDSVPVDTYDNLRFTVGLNSSLNSSAPSSYSSTSGADTVLSNNESALYAGANQGYYFLTITGNIDTSAAHNLNHPIPFTYQLAGDTFQISPPAASGGNTFSIIPGVPGAQFVHIIVDYGKLLQSFPITVPVILKTTSPTPQLDSIKNIFLYECSTPDGVC